MRLPFLPYHRHAAQPPVADAPALAAEAVCVRYPGMLTDALHHVTCRIPVGTCVALVGTNGSGKSTLLKAAAGLLPVAAGTLRLFGYPAGACPERVAYLPQRGELDWRFPISVRRLVLTGRYVHLGWLRRPGRRDLALAEAALERLGLGPLAERQIGELSGGQQQRALLARALAQDADLLLLDEPLNAIDAQTQATVNGVLADLRRAGKTAIVATHHLEDVEQIFDHILCLHEGRLVEPPVAEYAPHPPRARETTWTG